MLVVVAGPSGVGKGTVLRCVLEQLPDAELSVSATTRSPRPGELEGHHYHFLAAAEFDDLIVSGGFLEWAEYLGNRYGTPRREVNERIAAGRVVILEIEVQGAEQIRDLEREALLIFLAPPSLDELARRLRSRGTESPEHIDRRLAIAAAELEERHWFDHVVVNDDVDRACAEIVAIIRAARSAAAVPG